MVSLSPIPYRISDPDRSITGVQLTSSNWPDPSSRPFEHSRITFDSTHMYVDFEGLNQDGTSSITLTVNPTGETNTTTTITASPGGPIASDEGFGLIATVNDSTATGTVDVYQNSNSAANFIGNEYSEPR